MSDQQLKERLHGKVAIVGIGNPLKGDDGAGPALVERIRGKVRALCLDAGTSPESHAGRVLREDPDVILFVDAVHLNLPPGQWRILEKEDIAGGGLTTHNFSPRLLLDFLESQTKATLLLLGIQPGDLTLGAGLMEPVQKTIDELEKKLKEHLPCTKPT